MEALYTKEGRLNDMGTALTNDTNDALKDLFKQYRDLGYSPRGIAHVMQGAVWELELINVLDW